MSEPTLTLADYRLLATAGGAAPSLCNSQPWRFRPTHDACGLEVYVDTARAVPVTDPDGRARYVSVGAALFNLRTAAGQLGRRAEVRLLPDPARPELVALLDLSAPGGPSAPDLYAAIPHRHSSRRPFAGRDVPEAVIGELIAAAEAEGVVLEPLEEAGVRRVLAVTADAENRIAGDIARQAEARSWVHLEEPAADGIPAAALGSLDRDARVPMRNFGGYPPVMPSERYEPLPQVCTFSTHGDHPADWLRTGQALQRVWLLATVRGIRANVWHQAVEFPDTRWQLRDPSEGPGHVQMVMRMGYGPPGPSTPRRPVTEILDLTEYREAVR